MFCFTFFGASKLRFYYAPTVCKNFSPGLSDSHALPWVIVKTRVLEGEDGRKRLLCHFDGITLLKGEFNGSCYFSLAMTFLIQFT